ncbi:MAG: hypothetical protein IT378_23905 [Sandaracinaceae bacterium]|nr:hypothetical protein [Sandaracinaceae bacterium]
MTADKPAAAAPLPPIDWRTEGAPTFTNGARLYASAEQIALVFTDYLEARGERPSQAQAERIVASLRMTPEAFLRFLRGANETWNALAAGAELPRFEERSPRAT